jgi:hypothetical protein
VKTTLLNLNFIKRSGNYEPKLNAECCDNVNVLLFPPYTSKHEKQKTKRHKFSPQIFVYGCFVHQAVCGAPVDVYIFCFCTVSYKSIDNVLSECMIFISFTGKYS